MFLSMNQGGFEPPTYGLEGRRHIQTRLLVHTAQLRITI